MSHACALVIGPDVEGQLARYDENRDVEPYVDTCGDCEGTPKYQPCETCDSTGKALSTRNPEGRWDYWRIGGRHRGTLYLKDGAPGELGELSWEWKYEPEQDWTGRADVALAGDVDWLTTFAKMNPDAPPCTYALVVEGVMRERSEWNGSEWVDFPNWPEFWMRIVANLPPDAPLTIVDYHS